MLKINSKGLHNNHKEMESPSVLNSKPLAEENKFNAYKGRYQVHFDEEN